MGARYRGRLQAGRSFSSKWWYTGGPVTTKTVLATRSVQTCFDHNHRSGWRELASRLKLVDVGGPFRLLDATVVTSGSYYELEFKPTPTYSQYWQGDLLADSLTRDILSYRGLTNHTVGETWLKTICPPVASDTSLFTAGATAIARCRPTQPRVDVSTMLGELGVDGLPSVPGQSRNPGSEFLNLQFGIIPTSSDGLSLFNAVRQQADSIDRMLATSGKPIRRRYNFPTKQDVSRQLFTNKPPSVVLGNDLPNGQQATLGTVTRVTRSIEDTWFSGAYLHYFPENPFGRLVSALDAKYGILPGPSTVWSLAQWSWLIDWFTNAADVVSNLDNLGDTLVMPYAYIMRRSTYDVESSWSGQLRFNGVKTDVTMSDTLEMKVLQRHHAHPFGFGIDDSSLSAMQLAILAALGISRV